MDVFVETLQKLLQNFSEQLYFRLMLRSFLNCYWHTQKLNTVCSFHWVKKRFWKEINKYIVFRRTKIYKNKYFKRGLTWIHVKLKWAIFHEGFCEGKRIGLRWWQTKVTISFGKSLQTTYFHCYDKKLVKNYSLNFFKKRLPNLSLVLEILSASLIVYEDIFLGNFKVSNLAWHQNKFRWSSAIFLKCSALFFH